MLHDSERPPRPGHPTQRGGDKRRTHLAGHDTILRMEPLRERSQPPTLPLSGTRSAVFAAHLGNDARVTARLPFTLARRPAILTSSPRPERPASRLHSRPRYRTTRHALRAPL